MYEDEAALGLSMRVWNIRQIVINLLSIDALSVDVKHRVRELSKATYSIVFPSIKLKLATLSSVLSLHQLIRDGVVAARYVKMVETMLAVDIEALASQSWVSRLFVGDEMPMEEANVVGMFDASL